ncbi:MAG: 2-phosphosulfolactate phosphatase [Bacteroidales bacterium]|nr:2-phosphosulfolactate phosphatase [Bacteroidales bacterium]
MYSEKGKYTVEVCFSPLSWPLFEKENAVIILTDIFRATTSICAAFQNKVKSIIPVAEILESIAYKEKGYIVSGERDGKKLDCAEFGNSPFNFMEPRLQGKTVVMNTTNGTQAMKMVQKGNNLVGIGAFLNLDAICNWAMQQKRPVIVFCAGWKNRFSLEDTLFAGAAVNYILKNGKGDFHTMCDSAIASVDIWHQARINPRAYIEKAAHRHRLKKMGLDDILDYSMQLNINQCIPVLVDEEIVDMG